MCCVMTQLTFIKDYKQQDQYRKSFNELAISTFGINFEPWFKHGFWNERYICYSYLDGDKIVSNVSISKMQLVVNGEMKNSIQIGTVMTDPNYRKRGLATKLMNKVIEDYEKEVDLFYLFSSVETSPFYGKFDFKPLKESEYEVAVESSGKLEKIKKISLNNNKQLILDIYENKHSSTVLDVEKGEHVLGFYAVYMYSDFLYYIEDLQTLAIFSIEDDMLHLYAVISKEKLVFEELINRIATKEIKRVKFYFTPDFTDLEPVVSELINDDDIFHVRTSKAEIPQQFKFPVVAHA